jgi:hypothetical protein
MTVCGLFRGRIIIRNDLEGPGIAENPVTVETFMMKELVRKQLDISTRLILDLNLVAIYLDPAWNLRLKELWLRLPLPRVASSTLQLPSNYPRQSRVYLCILACSGWGWMGTGRKAKRRNKLSRPGLA